VRLDHLLSKEFITGLSYSLFSNKTESAKPVLNFGLLKLKGPIAQLVRAHA
jgi:hypothetical protein